MNPHAAVNPLARLLDEQGFIVLDGALATELENRGADLNDPLWSARILLAQPELIRQVHYDYFVAGADVAITASYQATYPGFAAQGIDRPEAQSVLLRSVALAVEARATFWSVEAHRAGRPFPLIAASIGPYGAYLADGSEYRGNYGLPRAELMDFHRARLRTLATSDADLLACETIPCVVEAEALVELLAELATEIPNAPQAWLSFACCNARQLNSGEPFQAAVARIVGSSHIAAIGVNCTAPAHIEGLLKQARAVTAKPLLVYPNRGETWNATIRQWVADPNAPELASHVQAWRAAGASGIGGCCRTGPRDIAELARQLRSHDRMTR